MSVQPNACTHRHFEGDLYMQHHQFGRLWTYVLTLAIAGLLAACAQAPAPPPIVQLIPDPTDASSSPFPSIDDSSTALDLGFTMTFYGQSYDQIYLNTNGGMTFGAGNDNYDVAASAISQPGIAVFWGDMDAGQYAESEVRTDQMAYQRFADKFVIYYDNYQDNDDDAWENTATVTLFPNGTIRFDYGTVGSEDILVGVFDGTHTSDQNVTVQGEYNNYTATSGTLIFDYWETGGTLHTGQLNGQTITFRP